MVRTDNREQKLDSFFTPQSKLCADALSSTVISECSVTESVIIFDEEERQINEPIAEGGLSSVGEITPHSSSSTSTVARRREIKLSSVRQLQQSIESNIHEG